MKFSFEKKFQMLKKNNKKLIKSKIYNTIFVGFCRFLNFKVLFRLHALIISSHELTEIPNDLFIRIQSTISFSIHQFLLFFHDKEYFDRFV